MATSTEALACAGALLLHSVARVEGDYIAFEAFLLDDQRLYQWAAVTKVCGLGMRFIRGIIAVDFVQVDYLRIESVLRHIEYEAAWLVGDRSCGIDLDRCQEILGATGLHTGLDKQAIHKSPILF